MYNSTHHGFPLQDFKPPHHGLNFSLEGFDNGTYGGLHQGIQEDPTTGGARILFPTVEDLKQQVPSTNEFDQQNRSQEGSAHGYWNGMLGGGSW